ncbi:citrulline utilization hydrolase CtlX [Fusobacterium sp.]|uniref:citrulline utilization hydrolase CtlX n=1 Tax=Fusobacterium sp. TaxID=68766 RepID=UPI00396C55A2
MNSQVTDKIVMVRPVQFKFNAQTAVNNHYQHQDGQSLEEVQKKALDEFDNFVNQLRNKGVTVEIIDDTLDPSTPDSIFPNNWFSTHQNGKVVLYPMYALNRRMELIKFKERLLEIARKKGTVVIDYSDRAEKNIFLEGTGSIVLDRKNKKAYCSLSPRSDKNLFEEFCKDVGFKPVTFTSYQDGNKIYHTNVMMGIGENKVIICLDCITDKNEREKVVYELKEGNKEIIEISLEQVKHFLGNVLEVKGTNGKRYIVISKTAYDSMTDDQIKRIEKDTEIICADVSTIEYYGGGSVRCMLGEIF